MKKENFYKIYLPALEKAFQNDTINFGFYVKSPEDYLDDELADKIEQYLEEHKDEFPEKVAYYFDAKSHNFPFVQGLSIDCYKADLMAEISKIKKEFSIN